MEIKETIQWQVDGMDCSSCAISIKKFLEKKGMKNVKVNYANGDVIFEQAGENNKEELAKGIRDLGYSVTSPGLQVQASKSFKILTTHLQRFLFCLPFTLVLMLHMIPGLHIHWLMNPWLQLAFTIPVYLLGMSFFGKSAWKSLRNRLPNMNVLIALGATAAFIYSLYGTLTGQG